MKRIEVNELERFALALIEAFGTPRDIAEPVARSLVSADVRGHGSHGVRRLATLYPAMIQDGELVPDARPSKLTSTDDRVSYEGNRGWGHYIGKKGIEQTLDCMDDSGYGLVTIRNAAHLGRIGAFAERAAHEGYIALCFTNTGGEAPMIAPPGSNQRRLATNPIAIGIPTFDKLPFSIVLDTSMSTVSHGKIMQKDLSGDPLPEGWAIGKDGKPLTDPSSFEDGEGAIYPIGGQSFGYKGAGLSIVFELMVGILADGNILGDEVEGRVNNSSVFILLDPTQLSEFANNGVRIGTFLEYLESSIYPDGIPTGEAWGDRIYLPGQPEYQLRIEREESGIPFDSNTIEELTDIAIQYGISQPEPTVS